MTQPLPRSASVENLKKQAKTLRRDWQAGNLAALKRVRDKHPSLARITDDVELVGAARLTECQLVIAREFGFDSWSALRLAIQLQDRQPAEQLFQCGLLDYTGANATDIALANQLLLEFPRLAEADIWTAAMLGDVDPIRQFLDDSPQFVNQNGGPNNWPPLMYLCYSRITDTSGDAIGAATLLLDRGADPNAAFTIEDCRFTCITGVIGEGEAGASYWPPHAHAVELVELLLTRGADPNDGQGLYNSMFSGGTHWLELLLAHGLNNEHRINWTGKDETKMLDYLLVQAAKYDQLDRAELLLANNADPNAVCFYDKRPCYVHAISRGNTDVADLLIKHGATEVEAGSDKERFVNACMASDDPAIAALEQQHTLPLLRRWASESVSKVGEAAGIGKPGGVSTMLRYGFPVHDALFEAAWNGHADIARMFIENGASARRRHSQHYVTPIAFADRAGHHELRDYLMEQDVDIFDAIRFDRPDLVARILTDDPQALERPLGDYGGEPKRAKETPLVAAVTYGNLEAVQLLLNAGAARDVLDCQGQNLTEIAKTQGSDEIVSLL